MIYDVNSIDAMGKRIDGGLVLFILSAGAIDASEQTQKTLLDKVENYLGYINSKEFQDKFADVDKNKIKIVFELEEQPPKLLMKLCERIVPWAEDNGAGFIVRVKANKGKMAKTEIFDAVRDGTYEDFMRYYKGDPNMFCEFYDLSLLSMATVADTNPDDKLKIVKFLLSEGADINFVDPRQKMNALHTFYFCVWRADPKYMLDMTKLLVENGIDLNCKDKYNAIPLKYAISLVKLPTNEIEDVYRYLISQGSDVTNKDVFNKSCLDYIQEFSWRNDVMKIVEECRNENKQ